MINQNFSNESTSGSAHERGPRYFDLLKHEHDYTLRIIHDN